MFTMLDTDDADQYHVHDTDDADDADNADETALADDADECNQVSDVYSRPNSQWGPRWSLQTIILLSDRSLRRGPIKIWKIGQIDFLTRGRCLYIGAFELI